MNGKLYIKYDADAGAVLAGPQGGMADVEGWLPFMKMESDNPLQRYSLKLNEELGVVMQMPEQAEEVPFTYKEERSQAYPKIADQLDMLFHDIANNKLTERGDFYAALKAVKDTYPKS